MKIVLAASGTRGDVQPALALAVALIQAGHELRMIGPPENKDWVEGYGCPFAALGSNFEELVQDFGTRQDLGTLIRFGGYLMRETEAQLAGLASHIAGADLAIGMSLVFGLRTVAEHLGLPTLFLATAPQLIPSTRHPTIATQNQNLPRWINRLDWFGSDTFGRLTYMRVINRERRRLGLAAYHGRPTRHLLEPLTFLISDEVLAPAPEDADLVCRQVGHLPLRQTGELSAEAEDFLAAGPPPVYIGFGSMPEEGEKTSRLLLEAARLSGQRLVLGRGWAHLEDLDPGKDHLVVGNVPHAKLFPRLAAVVHHGGAGTTATAARAGAPQIIVPHFFDQFYWAERIFRVGLGPKAMPRPKLTA
ncbi:MAG: glycosyltransferase, partial [Thermodesulfobacteriota bacterium]